ncbi:hypothetical protein BGZ68_008611 [Mortierella alpina]|nr:hypothetical protein BGZ68_008611 [Mortierella alpina]
MLSSLSIVRRSASGPLAPQVLTVAKTNVNLIRSSALTAARFYQSSSSSSSQASGDLSQSQFDSASLVSPVRSVNELSNYLSSLAPFTPPSSLSQEVFRHIESKQFSVPNMDGVSSIQHQIEPTPLQSIMDDLEDTNAMHMTSVLRKRKIKMRKHKYKKLRKRTRALRKKLGK